METTLDSPQFSRFGLIGQIVLVVALIPVGLILGALTGFPALSPILGMVVPLLAATWLLKRNDMSWRDVGFAKRMPVRAFVYYTLTALALVYVVVLFMLEPLLELAGFPPQDLSALKTMLEGNTLTYLIFLIPISWGSAAFGEELLVRGFIMNRLEHLTNAPLWSVIGQAAIFALAHTYQGVTGVLMVFTVGLIFGAIFYRCGRNLWPVIVAHGLVDTIAVTSFYLGLDWL